MVDLYDEAVEDIFHVGHGCETGLFGLNVDTLEVTHGVIGRVAEETARAAVRITFDRVGGDVLFQFVHHVDIIGDGDYGVGRVGIGECYHAIVDHEASDGIYADEADRVLRSVIVGTFEKSRLRIEVANLEIYDSRGSLEVGRNDV